MHIKFKIYLNKLRYRRLHIRFQHFCIFGLGQARLHQCWRRMFEAKCVSDKFELCVSISVANIRNQHICISVQDRVFLHGLLNSGYLTPFDYKCLCSKRWFYNTLHAYCMLPRLLFRNLKNCWWFCWPSKMTRPQNPEKNWMREIQSVSQQMKFQLKIFNETSLLTGNQVIIKCLNLFKIFIHSVFHDFWAPNRKVLTSALSGPDTCWDM